MIVIGYQGIGKTTLCNDKDANVLKCVDLESSSFFNDDGIRPDDWYVYYCNIAENLSKQNCLVFVSSHKVVRDRLFPSLELKDKWIEKLRLRYENTLTEKDFKALVNAEEKYEENIKELKNCGLHCIEINDIDYKLKELVIDYEIELMTNYLKETI